MTFSQTDLAAASGAQTAAATSATPQTRLIAGPGCGKSRTIEERVGWLLSRSVDPDRIRVTSFTRASVQDLSFRIGEYGQTHNIDGMDQVRVSTLHALALRVLRQAGLLARYPVDPIVLNEWETANIFDAEFSNSSGIAPSRCEDIRRYNEAYWQTGVFNPPNFIPPTPPISAAEQQAFQAFHGARTQLYSCVLPGEIIRQCVQEMRAGTLVPNEFLNLENLIVDEFQDLNPLDQEFVEHFIRAGVNTFICGDDDQSIYSFRFAAPEGIQRFVNTYPNAGNHFLAHCFRYGDNILNSGAILMAQFPVPNRVLKTYVSMYAHSTPAVPGDVFRWRFASGTDEAHAIALSCQRLIAGGMSGREILILLSNSRVLAAPIESALTVLGIPFESMRQEGFADSAPGRILFSILRIVCDRNDYVALRVLLGSLHGVGIGTCNDISQLAIANSLNYQALFYDPLPPGIFAGRRLTALNRARTVCAQVASWEPDDSITQHSVELLQILQSTYGQGFANDVHQFVQQFPQDMTLSELRDRMSADTDDQIDHIMSQVFDRLGLSEPEEGFVPPRVRIMTMHGAKGLSAQAVFVPGLEEQVFPGDRRRPYPGLILEGARLLYVSITRARLACFLSYAQTRLVHGRYQQQTASRYAAHTGGGFAGQANGLSLSQANAIVAAIQHL